MWIEVLHGLVPTAHQTSSRFTTIRGTKMNIEEQLRGMLQVLEMIRSTQCDGITPQMITSVTGKAKDQAIDDILQELHLYYQSNSPKLSGAAL
jgi:hypothetical protein